ncbi:MAG: hypothetical protein V4463_07050 [Pseudomonadota bacterium]
MNTQPLHFHEAMRRVLLWRVHLPHPALPPKASPPPQLAPLIDALRAVHAAFNAEALRYGHRYRSAYWMIFLLSAFAVLCGILPIALGWDQATHPWHAWAGAFGVAEIATIGAVALLYWRGRRSDWQAQWLAARTQAELAWYLPLLAPLVDFGKDGAAANWYVRTFEPGKDLQTLPALEDLCRANEALARELVPDLWKDPAFAPAYARWAAAVLHGQRYYHHQVYQREHALQHRIHGLTAALFALTAAGALAHLFVHAAWLTGLTTFFPALGGSLHGALAQSESFRLEHRSRRLEQEMASAAALLDRGADSVEQMRACVADALTLILDEHQDWHMLVRPHQLSLA